MIRHLIVLPDGTEISSGAAGAAVMAVRLTREVNSGTLLAPGAVSAAMAEITLFLPGKTIRAGDRLSLYTAEDRGLVGTFLAQEPTVSGPLLKITAYDPLILLDREISGYLQTFSWPMSLSELAAIVCDFCGVPLGSTDFPNGTFPVPCPAGDGFTGRQVMMWIAQAAGCFCRATPEGEAEFAWYTPAPLEIAGEATRCLGGVLCLGGRVEAGVLPLSGGVEAGCLCLLPRQYALSGGLRLDSAAICPIDRVQLRQTDSDMGLIYPDEAGENTLVIQGNPLLAAQSAQPLLPVAQTLYQRFCGLSYTPGTLKLPTTPGLDAGQTVTVTDGAGNRHTLYVMSLQREAGGDTVTCTGSYSRSSPEAVHNRAYETLQGKMLQLRADVDGLWAENSDNRGKLSALSLDLEGIRGAVSGYEGDAQRLTTLEQTAAALRLSVESIHSQGAAKLKTAMGYTFDDQGLSIARAGEAMENRLDNQGMQVLRSGQPILQADHRGVTARDVTVQNYLIVGSHARFEDYMGGKTACFWLEG